MNINFMLPREITSLSPSVIFITMFTFSISISISNGLNRIWAIESSQFGSSNAWRAMFAELVKGQINEN